MIDTDNWPEWGSTGEKPPDGLDYSGADNPDARHFNYLWYNIKQTFETISDVLSNEVERLDGRVDDTETLIDDVDEQLSSDLESEAHRLDGRIDDVDEQLSHVEVRSSDPDSPSQGQMWLREDEF